ncbi:MAG: TIM barrel protein [archaeon]
MIRIGTAGAAELYTREGLQSLKDEGLNAMEVEFTYGVRMSNNAALGIGADAKKLGIALSVHAPYYVNLASKEKPKIHASAHRVLESCEKAHHLGATHVVFHPAFLQGRASEEVFPIVCEQIQKMQDVIDESGWKVNLAPETTGKQSQFGDVDELLRLRDETGCSMCVDFAHLLARTGSIDYTGVFDKLRPLKHIHAHFSGIEYGDKGERRHILTTEDVIEPFLKEVVKRNADITIINESPDPVSDAVKTLGVLRNII